MNRKWWVGRQTDCRDISRPVAQMRFFLSSRQRFASNVERDGPDLVRERVSRPWRGSFSSSRCSQPFSRLYLVSAFTSSSRWTLAYLMALCLANLNYECCERHGSLTWPNQITWIYCPNASVLFHRGSMAAFTLLLCWTKGRSSPARSVRRNQFRRKLTRCLAMCAHVSGDRLVKPRLDNS